MFSRLAKSQSPANASSVAVFLSPARASRSRINCT